MASDDPVEVILIVDEIHRRSIGDVIKRLEESGVEISNTLESLGMIVGLARPNAVEALSRIEGVAAVEKTRTERAIDDV